MRTENRDVLSSGLISTVEQNVPSLAHSMQSLQAGQKELFPEEQKAVFLSQIKGEYLKRQSDYSQELLNLFHNYHEERISQARISFYAALALLVVGTLIVFVGVILLFMGNIQAGTITLVSGTITDVVSLLVLKFYGDSNNRLDKTAKGVDAQVAKEMSILTTVNVAVDLFASGETPKNTAENLVNKIHAYALSASADIA